MRSSYEKELRRERRRQGICTSCGKNETHGTAMCIECITYFRKRRTEKKRNRTGGTTGTPVAI